ncbi:hypothetical protein BU26DRAFT_521207 [Trematosphaeria pertusa]|uniref:F-box domain-containing protein n=1 Tax=Trematosphaeria pertusa TaxID=390896 RepID=A0A6A6I893_9PLEO|nr:uncharacterized protein BU26DRAFT_521207 [Trematosphaeria pertusa]KAF2246774.1 hypothetical protein BU26DRAFT_521207 [Trematosphaeria pertusa]
MSAGPDLIMSSLLIPSSRLPACVAPWWRYPTWAQSREKRSSHTPPEPANPRNIPYLPREIHTLICSYLPGEALCSYRRASKAFAHIGAKCLFQTIKFHASNSSFNRLASIATHDIRRKSVDTILWDTHLWNLKLRWEEDDDEIADEVEFERWLGAVNEFGKLRLAALGEAPGSLQKAHQLLRAGGLAGLSDTQQFALQIQFEQYRVRRREEVNLLKGLLSPPSMRRVLERFPNLKTISIKKNHLKYYLGRSHMDDPPAGPVHPIELVPRGVGSHADLYEEDLSDVLALQSALYAGHPTLQQVHADELTWRAFDPSNYHPWLGRSTADLTSIRLKFNLVPAVSDTIAGRLNIREIQDTFREGLLKEFLFSFKSLRTIEIDFNVPRYEVQDTWDRGGVDLCDVFPNHQAWPHLQNLSMAYIDSSQKDLVDLLSSHASSLRSLTLIDVELRQPGSWRAILTCIQPLLSSLRHASIENKSYPVCHGFDNADDMEILYVNAAELGKQLGDFLVRGGECPIGRDEVEGKCYWDNPVTQQREWATQFQLPLD